MRIAVVGAGAIGAYCGAAMCRGGAEVHLIARNQHLEAGKHLELDAIVTAVVELADITGAAAPTLRAVHAATDLLGRTCTPIAPTAPRGARR